ncbi:hypothetical protein [Citromicrobium bathyomarinum]|uniref:hypothetical protein n=1 Tax=Citromicrobium bathyomarinum TaxID=72174 RepID=UPI00315A9F76
MNWLTLASVSQTEFGFVDDRSLFYDPVPAYIVLVAMGVIVAMIVHALISHFACKLPGKVRVVLAVLSPITALYLIRLANRSNYDGSLSAGLDDAIYITGDEILVPCVIVASAIVVAIMERKSKSNNLRSRFSDNP